MPSFEPLRNRDACAAIRGFVYQVDVTIQRWLTLGEKQHLELERGEDIDVVCNAFSGGDEESRRLLEQVKHRTASVTLRDTSVLSTLACAVEHLSSNPDLDLFFQYTTNAGVGTERPAVMPDRTPCIEVWGQLHDAPTGDHNTEPRLELLRQFLLNAPKPPELQNATWSNFGEFLASASNVSFLGFVRRFEFRTDAPQSPTQPRQIQNTLISDGLARDQMHAEEIYNRLFLFVFKRLSEGGLKRLGHDDLAQQVALPTLSGSDHHLLETLRGRLGELETRVGDIEMALWGVRDDIACLTERQSVHSAIRYTLATPVLDPPPFPERISHRQKAVAKLTKLILSHVWTGVFGKRPS